MISHTLVAFLALLAMPLAAFIVARRRPPYQAVLLVLVVAALFGPVRAQIDLPLMPPLDKAKMSALGLFVVAMVKWRHHIRRAGWFTPWELLIVLGFVGHVVTSLNNTDSYVAGPPWRLVFTPGLQLRDGLNDALGTFFSLSTPFLLGRWFIRTPRHLDYALRLLVLNGLIQAMLALVEIRFSPQIHRWVYGYSITGFDQSLRWGGYRPNVLTVHGLTFSMVMFWCCSSAQILSRTQPQLLLSRYRLRIKRVAWVLSGALVLCKSMGPIFYGLIVGVIVRLGRPRGAMTLAFLLGGLVVTYPILRSRDLVPVEDILAFVEHNISEDRAGSLRFRLVNEAGLMRRAQLRPWFGWGGYGRAFDYGSASEPAYLVGDGEWVLVLGSTGFVGFAHHFGLIVLPVLAAFFRYRRVVDPTLQWQLAGFTLVLAFQCFDLLPNSSQNVLPKLFAGALAGMLSEIRRPGSEWRARPAG